jgi:polysaccharide pyruvyl transferase WcaK-like protein
VVREWSGSDCYKKVVAAVADRFTRDGWEIVLIPFHFPEDVQACREVSLLMQETSLMVRTWQAVETLFGLLGELDLVLAMRLHAIIMASVMRVPCVGISYDPKVERFLELVGQPNAGGVDGLEEEALYRVLLEAWERRQETVANLDRVLAHLRQQAWETASLTLSVFYARSPRKRRELQRSGRGGGEALGSRLVSARGRGRGASRP